MGVATVQSIGDTSRMNGGKLQGMMRSYLYEIYKVTSIVLHAALPDDFFNVFFFVVIP